MGENLGERIRTIVVEQLGVEQTFEEFLGVDDRGVGESASRLVDAVGRGSPC